MTILLGIFVLGVVIFLHESGHFLAAKLVGAPAPVFSIGLGPVLLRFHWHGTEYRLSALPIGGYVMFGREDETSSLGSLQRIFIYAAGPLANFLTAIVIYHDPAVFFAQLLGLLSVVGKLLTLQIGLESLAGPIGIFQVAGGQVAAGWSATLGFVAFLSLNLAVLNLLPLPILDGGQILFAAAEGVTRRRINLQVRVAMAIICWLLVLLLVATVSFHDLRRIVST